MSSNDPTDDAPDGATVHRPAGGTSGADPTADLPPRDGTSVRTPGQLEARATVPANPDAVPGYELLGELGRGGMGVVYRARDTRLNREVGLKMILRADADRMTVARFWAEAEVMAAVKHPHVVQVHELGEHAGRPFMAMEFVSGGSLDRRLKDGPFTPRAATELLAKVASGVGAAHELGIVHRDLKPGNILLAPDGTPKVTDFGIAKRKAHDLTQTNAMMGTPAYMAPEQAAAKAKFVGPQADVWALGIILYECVAGMRPFTGDTVEAVLIEIAFGEPTALRTVARNVPRDLDTIIAKCLSKEWEHRYATAAELAADLQRFVNGEPIAARPVGPVERFGRWVRRKPTAAAAWGFSSLALALALVVLAVFGSWREAVSARGSAVSAKRDAEAARDQLADEKKQTELARDEALRQKGIADAGRVEEVRLRGIADAGRVEEARLRGIGEAARDEALVQKGIADKAREEAVTQKGLADKAREEAVRLQGVAENAQLAEAAARKKLEVFEYGRTVQLAHQEWRDNNIMGAQALLASTQPHLRGWEWKYVHRLSNSSALTLRHINSVHRAAYSSDGTRIVTASSHAQIWDAQTGVNLLTFKGHTGDVRSAAFSADGALVVTGGQDKTAKVWDAQTGAELLTLQGHAGWVVAASFNHDGSRVVTAGYDRDVRVWDAKTGTELLTLKGHTDNVHSAAFNSDGTQIITGSLDKTTKVWDAKTGKDLLTLKGHTGGVMCAAFGPDGTQIITGSLDKTAKVWDAKTGAELYTLAGHTGGLNSATFRADGALIVTGSTDNTAKVWDVKLKAPVNTFKGHTAQTAFLRSAAFSPDGTKVVTASEDRTAKVWDVSTVAEALTFGGANKGSIYSAALRPDGTRAVTGRGTIGGREVGLVFPSFVGSAW